MTDLEEYENDYLERLKKKQTGEETIEDEELDDDVIQFNYVNQKTKPTGRKAPIFEITNIHCHSELETMITIDYKHPMSVRERLFFSRKNSPSLYSRDYIKKSISNFVRFEIETTRAKNTKWSYGGTKEIGDNFESGYTLNVGFTDDEQIVRRVLVKVLMEYKFGCFPSSNSILAHRDAQYPTESEAAKILNSIAKSFVGGKTSKIRNFPKPTISAKNDTASISEARQLLARARKARQARQAQSQKRA